MDALVTMTGWVGTTVEQRELPTCTTARFRLAHTPRVNRQGEWRDGETTWLDVTCFRTLAENVASSLGKGEPVIVSGRLRTERWTGRLDGQEHERLVLEAVAVGHDLSKGVAMFRKGERVTPIRRPADPLRDDGAVEEVVGGDEPLEDPSDAPVPVAVG